MEQDDFHKIGNEFFRKRLGKYKKLGLSYSAFWDKAYQDFIRFQLGKTDQGIRHCKSVENYIWILLENHLEFFSPEALYLISISCAVHDIAKTQLDVSEHALEAAKIIHDKFVQSGYVKSRATADAVAHIVSAHDKGDFSQIPLEYVVGEDTVVFLKSLAAIFRLADMMDNCEGRAAKFHKVYSLPLPGRDDFLNDVRDSIMSSLPCKTDKRFIEIQACPTSAKTRTTIELYVQGLNEDMSSEHEELLQNVHTRYIKGHKSKEKTFSLPYKFKLTWVSYKPALAQKRAEVSDTVISAPTITRPTKCYFLNTETSLILKERLIESLKARRDIDSKYLYWSVSGTRNYLELCRNPNYTLPYVAENLLRDKFRRELCPLVQQKGSKVQLVDLGVGYGEEPNILINALLEKLKPDENLNCVLVDFSYHMLQMCVYYIDESNMEKTKYRDNTNVIAVNADFRNLPKFKSKIPDSESHRLFVFLGGTIGNYSEREMLNIISSMMTKVDFLLLGVDLVDDLSDEDLLASYSSRYNQKFLFSPLSEVGYSIDDCRFECTMEESISDIEDAKTVCSYFYLPGGEKIRVAYSTKYNLDALKIYLVSKSKLEVLKVVTVDKEAYSILLLKRML